MIVKYRHILLMAMAFVIPFWIKGVVMDQSLIELSIYAVKTRPVNVDLFNLGKARLLMMGTSLLLLELLYLILTHQIQIKGHPALFGILGFYVCLVIATLHSPYQDVVYEGFSDRYEGFYVYSYYIALVFLCFFILTNRRMMRQVLTALLASVIGVFILVLLEIHNIEVGIYRPLRPLIFMGTDSMNEGFVDLFYSLYQSRIKPGFQFATGPLFNPNYLGVYGGVMVILGLGLLWTEARRRTSILYGILTAMAYCVLLASGANSSFYLMLVMAACQVAYVIWRKRPSEYKGKFLGLLLLGIGLFVGMNGISEGAIYREFVQKYLPERTSESQVSLSTEARPDIQAIDFHKESVTFDDGIRSVSFILGEEGITPIYEDVAENTENRGNREIIENIEGWSFDVGATDEPYAFMHYGKKIYLGTDTSGRVGVVTSHGLVRELSEPIPLIMDGRAISNRGYIWSVAVHLIMKQPLIGHGPDTYPIYQPKGDLINLLRFRSSTSSTSINPHNLYLQWAFITGIIGLLCMLVSLLLIGTQGLKRMAQGDSTGLYVLVPLFFFLTTSIVNDTVVGTGIILYLLIGITLAWLYNTQETS